MTDEAVRVKKKYFQKYYDENKEKMDKYNRKWRAENPNKVKKYNRNYWERKAQISCVGL